MEMSLRLQLRKYTAFIVDYSVLAAFGGAMYVLIELLWRGRSTVEMFWLAAICSIFIALLNTIFTYDVDYLVQVFSCGIFCTIAEYICGMCYNSDYHIWDYRTLPLSSPDGQINLFFTFAWMGISAVGIILMDYIEWKVFKYRYDTPPYYRVVCKTFYPFGGEKGGTCTH